MQKRRTLSFLAGLAVSIMATAQYAGAGGHDPWSRVRDRLSGLPCEVPDVPDDSISANLRLLKAFPLPPGGLTAAEIDIRGNLLLATRAMGHGQIVVVNIANPLKPKVLSYFELEDGIGARDVKFSPDGKTAVVGIGRPGPTSGVVGEGGVALVDIRNPKAPSLVGEWFSPTPGPLQDGHMIHVEEIGGTQWVFLAPFDGGGVMILKLEGPPEARTLTFVTRTLPVGAYGPHDMYVQFDPTLEEWIMYEADGFTGWLAYNVSNPSEPELVGGFRHPSAGSTHTVVSTTIGDTRIVASIEETGFDLLKVFDATDLDRPRLLGTWHSTSQTEPAAAQHNIQIVDGLLYMAHWEQGSYIFDLRDLVEDPLGNATELHPIAHYIPEYPDGTHGSFWDVVVYKGALFSSDWAIQGGLHVVGFGCNRAGDTALTSDA